MFDVLFDCLLVYAYAFVLVTNGLTGTVYLNACCLWFICFIFFLDNNKNRLNINLDTPDGSFLHCC